MADFETLTDEEIALTAQAGDDKATEYLLAKYKNFVRSKARSYFLVGADHEDVVQEGMIGLFKAIRDFRDDRQASFRAFADTCITRQIITAIKTATRQKHIPLNSYISLDKPVYDGEGDRTLMEVVREDNVSNPENVMISGEEFRLINHMIGSSLTNLERVALTGYMEGKSYQLISEESGYHTKAIDNALQRVKKKLLKYMEKK